MAILAFVSYICRSGLEFFILDQGCICRPGLNLSFWAEIQFLPTDDHTFTKSIEWNSGKYSKFYGTLDPLGPIGALCRAPFVKSEFFFFCVFSRYLCNEESSVDLTLILLCRAQEPFIAQSIFREMLPALRKTCLLRHVTSRFVTVNLFSNKRTPNGYYVPPWVNFRIL